MKIPIKWKMTFHPNPISDWTLRRYYFMLIVALVVLPFGFLEIRHPTCSGSVVPWLKFYGYTAMLYVYMFWTWVTTERMRDARAARLRMKEPFDMDLKYPAPVTFRPKE